MKRFFLLAVTAIICFMPFISKAQEHEINKDQYAGLGKAASAIFFSDKRYSVSGFGELNYVHYPPGGINKNSNDLELYYTNLYRLSGFFGYKISKNIIFNSEIMVEYLHEGSNESHHEIAIEAYLDFILNKNFNARVGLMPLPIGYINSNDEPVLFYSVNRPEVERLIIPSTWIELGAMLYGKIVPDLHYFAGVSGGLNSKDFTSGTWIRNGRPFDIKFPNSVSYNAQLIYNGVKNTQLSVSGYYGPTSQGETISTINGTQESFKANVGVISGYAKYEYDRFRLIMMGTYGRLGDTEKIFELTKNDENGQGEVLGKETYGAYIETGYDILPFFMKKHKSVDGKREKGLFKKSEFELPLFVRYERLNTHSDIAESLKQYNRIENNMQILTVGANFKPQEDIVFKINYQFRNNLYNGSGIKESNILEFGIGFNY
ncbi:hypothetical protein [Aureibacter tunicatorum]|uniref:Phosphate-selective porin O and P n=1 Tax=Aureibacter tunicatorum TaxID=866807 RepID=A0AAE3XH19_9BACT|nr:hypothetical protein [Aureibacter tunicatorum]MDR6237501.1 hypothetical protein [Aureibacter tunicatorum]